MWLKSFKGKKSPCCTTNFGVFSKGSLVRSHGAQELAAWVGSFFIHHITSRFLITVYPIVEAFVVCENLRAGVTATLSKSLLDFSYSPDPIDHMDTSRQNSTTAPSDLELDMKIISPFVACGDLRFVPFQFSLDGAKPEPFLDFNSGFSPRILP